MDTAKVIVRRTKTGDETVTGFTYTDGDGTTGFEAPVEQMEFSMTPLQAIAAVETGGFEVAPSSKSQTEEEIS